MSARTPPEKLAPAVYTQPREKDPRYNAGQAQLGVDSAVALEFRGSPNVGQWGREGERLWLAGKEEFAYCIYIRGQLFKIKCSCQHLSIRKSRGFAQTDLSVPDCA